MATENTRLLPLSTSSDFQRPVENLNYLGSGVKQCMQILSWDKEVIIDIHNSF